MSGAPNGTLNNLFPVISMLGFAAAWYVDGIYTATAVLMGLMTLHILLLFFTRRMHKPTLFMWLLVVVLGTLTLLLRDKAFIQLKTTIVYGVFAALLLGADVLGKNLPRLLLGNFFAAPAAVWRRVSTAAAVYFLLLSLCNYLVAKYLSEGAWVSIKTFAFPAATFVFTLLLMVYLFRYARDDSSS